MNSSWINEVGITTGIAIIAFGWLWLWLCFKGIVNFPLWMVNLFPGYNIHRARRQAERKLRWAEKRRKYWETQWLERVWGYQWVCTLPDGTSFAGRGWATDSIPIQHHQSRVDIAPLSESIRRIEQGLG